MRFTRPPKDVVLAVRDATPATGTATVRFDIKELQRRAFERGREVERQESRRGLASVAATLSAEARTLKSRLAADAARVEEFAVQLALLVAERVIGACIDDGQHDVRALVTETLQGLDPHARAGSIEVKLSPADHARFIAAEHDRPSGLEHLTIVADPTMADGAVRLLAGEAEYNSTAIQRIEGLRSVLGKEARDADSRD